MRKVRKSMLNEKLKQKIDERNKRWREHPETCHVTVNATSLEELENDVRECTNLDTLIPGESREAYIVRLKKSAKEC